MAALNRLFTSENYQRVAFIGIAKNCGKTTTLNYALRLAIAQEHPSLGLMSVGIDGETQDFLLGSVKPEIFVQENTWVVTAQRAAEQSTATLEYVEPLGYSTPLGDVFIARTLDPGTIILAGVRHRQDILDATQRMRDSLNIKTIFIDGAYGRTAAAHSAVADACIFSTGAMAGATIEEIVEHSAAFLDKIALPRPTQPEHLMAGNYCIDNQRVCLGRGEQIEVLPLSNRSILMELKNLHKYWTKETSILAIPGLISNRVIEHLLALPDHNNILIVPDPTVFHVSRRLWRRLLATWTVYAMHTPELLAISVNPTSICGRIVDEIQLMQALQTRWPETPIFNPMNASVHREPSS